ncbi:MAG: NAD(P)-dependent oxidoreductase [Bryobacterales bacterium]|nr:NAD(P)-dependent oxidoreductase [Bryobacterales bacterium]
MITTSEELEERLSRPTEEDCRAVRELGGHLLLLGAGGKMGPSLAVRAKRAIEITGVPWRVIAVSRFTETAQWDYLNQAGVETIAADLMDSACLLHLPDAPNIVFMAGRKFGTAGAEYLTWGMNSLVPALVADRFRTSRIVAFSSGNVYPFMRTSEGGATEDVKTEPVGEYAQSVRGRERMFELASHRHGTKVLLLRLNYAVELRYGVLLDIGRKVFAGQPVDVSMACVNVMWQGDANSVALRSFSLCASPPTVLNLTGPETLSVRRIAAVFGRWFEQVPNITGIEAETALLNDAGKCHRLFGYPSVSVDELIEWTADWIRAGGADLDKPTHFEARDGRY